MFEDDEGSEDDEGYSESSDIDLIENNPFSNDEDVDDEIDFGSDEPNDEDGHPDEDEDEEFTEERYKNLQREFTKTKEDLKSQSEKTEAMEHKLVKFGGIDKAAGLLEYVSSDPDFLSLADKKSKGEVTSGIDESKLSPEQKEAYTTVKQMVESVITPFKQQMNNQLKEAIETHVTPASDAVSDMILEGHIDKMTEKYGEGWLSQLDSMQSMKGTMSEKSQKAPTLDDINELFHRSLRKDGKFDTFILSQAKIISERQTKKSQKRPKNSSGGSSTKSKKADGKVKDIFEAGAIALRKMKA